MSNSSGGHVCHSPQHASSPVYVSSSGPSSTGDRCSVTRLAGAVDVHVSTISPARQSHSEAQDDPGGRGDIHSPLVAVRIVVSTLTTSVCGSLSFFSLLPRPAVSASMEALMQHYQAAGFSKEVSSLAAASRRPCTNKMYDDRWLSFATGQGFDPLDSTAAQIATFLYDLFDTHGYQGIRLSRDTGPA